MSTSIFYFFWNSGQTVGWWNTHLDLTQYFQNIWSSNLKVSCALNEKKSSSCMCPLSAVEARWTSNLEEIQRSRVRSSQGMRKLFFLFFPNIFYATFAYSVLIIFMQTFENFLVLFRIQMNDCKQFEIFDCVLTLSQVTKEPFVCQNKRVMTTTTMYIVPIRIVACGWRTVEFVVATLTVSISMIISNSMNRMGTLDCSC